MRTTGVRRRGMLFGLIVIAALILGGCADLFYSSSDQKGAGDVYYADFPDVPIPSEMELDGGRGEVGKSAAGNPIGYLEFSGSADWDSLVNVCASNLTRDGWSVIGLFRGKRSMIVADKMDRICVISIFDGFPSTTMSLWVTDKTNGFIAPLSAPEKTSGNGNDDSYVISTGSGSGGGSGVQEQGLAE